VAFLDRMSPSWKTFSHLQLGTFSLAGIWAALIFGSEGQIVEVNYSQLLIHVSGISFLWTSDHKILYYQSLCIASCIRKVMTDILRFSSTLRAIADDVVLIPSGMRMFRLLPFVSWVYFYSPSQKSNAFFELYGHRYPNPYSEIIHEGLLIW